MLEERPDVLQALAMHLGSVRNVWLALGATGLDRHPGVQAMLVSGKGSLSRGNRKKAVDIIYHCDGPTMFSGYAAGDVQPPDDPDKARHGGAQHKQLTSVLD